MGFGMAGAMGKMMAGAMSRAKKRAAGPGPAAGGAFGAMKQHMAGGPGAAAGAAKRPVNAFQAGAMKRMQKRARFGR